MKADKRGRAINRLQSELGQYKKAIRRMAEDYFKFGSQKDGLLNVDKFIKVYLDKALPDRINEEVVTTIAIENSFDGFEFEQVFENKSVFLRKGYVTLRKIKKIVGKKMFDSLAYYLLYHKEIPLDISLAWLRTHKPKLFKTTMIEYGLGDALLDFRIKKNTTIKSKRAQLLRDINYKELFGVERALELHPCYFDTL